MNKRQKSFNSRPHEEVDHVSLSGTQTIKCFNSRPHEEVDAEIILKEDKMMLFQLTTSRRGRLQVRSCVQSCLHVSTHDLTKRSTNDFLVALFSGVFQLTTSRRGRQFQEGDVALSERVSTHDLTKRSTAIFTQKVFLSKSLFVLIAYNIFILH